MYDDDDDVGFTAGGVPSKLSSLESEAYVDRAGRKKMDELQRESKGLYDKLQSLQEELRLREQTSDTVINDLKLQLSEAQLKTKELEEHNTILQSKFDAEQSESETLVETKRMASQLEIELINLRSELQEQGLRVREREYAVIELESALASAKKDLTDARKDCEALVLEHKEHVARLEEKNKADIEQVTREVRTDMKQKVEKYLSDLGDENDRLEDTLAQTNVEVRSLRMQLERAGEELQQLQQVTGETISGVEYIHTMGSSSSSSHSGGGRSIFASASSTVRHSSSALRLEGSVDAAFKGLDLQTTSSTSPSGNRSTSPGSPQSLSGAVGGRTLVRVQKKDYYSKDSDPESEVGVGWMK